MLVTGLAKTADRGNKAFLIQQLQKISTKADFGSLAKMMTDASFSVYAASAIANTPGVVAEVTNLITEGTLPKDKLAYLAQFKNLATPTVENALLSWAKGADNKTLRAVYNALAVCGSAKSLPVPQQLLRLRDSPTTLQVPTTHICNCSARWR